jgi:hypothetical protein
MTPRWIRPDLSPLVATAALLIACGGDAGSGVSGDKELIALTDPEAAQVCGYLADVLGAARMVTCGGVTITISPVEAAACTAAFVAFRTEAPTCGAKVADAERCVEELAAQTEAEICSESGGIPSACLVLFTCGMPF